LKCMEPLKFLLKELFNNAVPHFTSFDTFFIALRDKLELALKARYTGKFILESSDYNKYALFFFTPNLKGLDAFVQSCWKVDSVSGAGHFHKKANLSLFTPENQHVREVLDFINSKGVVTNRDLYEFGLRCTLLTKMTNEALNILREQRKVIALAADSKGDPRKGANFLGYNPKRTIHFKPAH